MDKKKKLLAHPLYSKESIPSSRLHLQTRHRSLQALRRSDNTARRRTISVMWSVMFWYLASEPCCSVLCMHTWPEGITERSDGRQVRGHTPFTGASMQVSRSAWVSRSCLTMTHDADVRNQICCSMRSTEVQLSAYPFLCFLAYSGGIVCLIKAVSTSVWFTRHSACHCKGVASRRSCRAVHPPMTDCDAQAF